jgi:hypothetical protein
MGMQFLIRPSGRTFLMAVCMAALLPDPSLHSQVPVQLAPKKPSAAVAQYVGPTVPDVRGQTCDQAKQTLLSQVHLVGRCIGELVEGAVVSDQLPVAGSPARGVQVSLTGRGYGFPSAAHQCHVPVRLGRRDIGNNQRIQVDTRVRLPM